MYSPPPENLSCAVRYGILEATPAERRPGEHRGGCWLGRSLYAFFPSVLLVVDSTTKYLLPTQHRVEHPEFHGHCLCYQSAVGARRRARSRYFLPPRVTTRRLTVYTLLCV